MSFYNDDFMPIVEKILDEIKSKGNKTFRTIDVINEHRGHFHADHTNVHDSTNANVGKFLSENAKVLKIKKIADNQHCVDSDGNPSSTAVWEFI
jgi:hypothetical protein